MTHTLPNRATAQLRQSDACGPTHPSIPHSGWHVMHSRPEDVNARYVWLGHCVTHAPLCSAKRHRVHSVGAGPVHPPSHAGWHCSHTPSTARATHPAGHCATHSPTWLTLAHATHASAPASVHPPRHWASHRTHVVPLTVAQSGGHCDTHRTLPGVGSSSAVSCRQPSVQAVGPVPEHAPVPPHALSHSPHEPLVCKNRVVEHAVQPFAPGALQLRHVGWHALHTETLGPVVYQPREHVVTHSPFSTTLTQPCPCGNVEAFRGVH